MKSQRNRKNSECQNNIKTKISKAIQSPKTIFKNLPQIQLNGNKEALVESSCGILEYDENVIRLNTDGFIIKFLGQDLSLNCMTNENVIVSGTIFSIELS